MTLSKIRKELRAVIRHRNRLIDSGLMTQAIRNEINDLYDRERDLRRMEDSLENLPCTYRITGYKMLHERLAQGVRQ